MVLLIATGPTYINACGEWVPSRPSPAVRRPYNYVVRFRNNWNQVICVWFSQEGQGLGSFDVEPGKSCLVTGIGDGVLSATVYRINGFDEECFLQQADIVITCDNVSLSLGANSIH